MPGAFSRPPQGRYLHFHAASALRAKARRLHRQALLTAVVGVRRRAVTTVGTVTAFATAVPAELL
ncbi:hypothetical protein J3A64_002583 [Pseudarthrobacter sp. PvP004]|nr:hypothetical protein [Pseudarthrobacter sp. PvP004]